MKETQAYGYKITWFAFLPGAVLAAIGCACFQNPKDRMNWIVDAPLRTEDVNHAAAPVGSDRDSANEEKVADMA